MLTLSILQMTSQTSSAGTLYPIAISGQPAPDGNGVFGGEGTGAGEFDPPVLNNRGVVCFSVNIRGSTGTYAASGVFCGVPGITTQVARGGQLPGVLAGGQFRIVDRNSGAINDAGQVAFKSGVTPVMGGNTDAVFRKGSGRDSFSLFARGGDPAPGEGNFGSILSSNWIPALSPAGHVAFFADLTGTNGGTADDTGIFRSNAAGDSVVQIVQEGDPVPGNSGTLTPNGTTPAVNASGEVAFKAGVLGVDGTSRHAIVRGDGQTRTLIANFGTAIPGLGTIRDLGGGTVSMNSSGEVAFYAPTILSVSPFTPSTAALIGDSEADLEIVAKAGDRLANFPGDLGRVDQHVMVNDAGQVAYLGSITADSGGALTALFRGKSVVAYNGLAPSGSGVSIIGMTNREFVINSAGKIAFSAQISIPGAANGFGIYVWDGAGNYEEVIRHGVPFLGSTVTGLNFAGTSGNVLQPGMNGFNDLGEVTFRFELADGREGIALWSSLPKPASVVGGQIQSVAGGFQVRFPGVPGWDYVIERDEDLVPPWTRLSPAFRANDAGWITLDDLGPGLPQKRFYRCAEAP